MRFFILQLLVVISLTRTALSLEFQNYTHTLTSYTGFIGVLQVSVTSNASVDVFLSNGYNFNGHKSLNFYGTVIIVDLDRDLNVTTHCNELWCEGVISVKFLYSYEIVALLVFLSVLVAVTPFGLYCFEGATSWKILHL